MKLYKYISIICAFAIITSLISACSNDDMQVVEETIEVSFCAELPKSIVTRAAELNDYKLYCGVFEKGVEIMTLRSTINIVAGQPIVFAPRLVKGRTYDIAFWASKAGAYNVTNMKAISRTSPAITTISEADYDAFTANTTITVDGDNLSQNITLFRPFAQLNMGASEADWNNVVSGGKTPTTINLTIKDVKDSFNALSGNAYGSSSADFTYTLPITGNDFSVNGNIYKNIAQCYVLMNSPQQYDSSAFNLTYSIYDQDGNTIQQDASLIHIPLQANYKTNVVGALLTGITTYTITDDSYNDDNNN